LDIDYENKIKKFVNGIPSQDSAHHFDHIERVVSNARYLAQIEQAKTEIVVPAAYLHDCVNLRKDDPNRSKSSALAADKAIGFLSSINYPSEYFDSIHHAILAHSFSANIQPLTLEAKVVQDADRLDSLGAIGIARCIQVGTQLGRSLYCEDDAICVHRVPDDTQYTIDHFHTKLLKLAECMHTEAARRSASERTEFMKNYLMQLSSELGPDASWNS